MAEPVDEIGLPALAGTVVTQAMFDTEVATACGPKGLPGLSTAARLGITGTTQVLRSR